MSPSDVLGMVKAWMSGDTAATMELADAFREYANDEETALKVLDPIIGRYYVLASSTLESGLGVDFSKARSDEEICLMIKQDNLDPDDHVAGGLDVLRDGRVIYREIEIPPEDEEEDEEGVCFFVEEDSSFNPFDSEEKPHP